MIPKTIHYCWFGGNPLPELALRCIKSWKKYCPDFEIVEWSEENFDISAAPLYVRQAYEAKKWAFVSDYARLRILYDNGGIYYDTDVELVKSPEHLLAYSAWFGFEEETLVNTGLGFGAEKGAPILADMLADYQDIPFVLEDGSFDMTPCPTRNTAALARAGLILNNTQQILPGNVAVFPKDWFCPLEYLTGRLYKTKNTVSIHRYAASWYSEKEKAWFKRASAEMKRELRRERYVNGPKRLIIKLIGEDRHQKLKRLIKRS